MVLASRDRLSRIVKVNETYVGGKKSGKRGSGADGKALAGIAVQDKYVKGIGRIRLCHLKDAFTAKLKPFMQRIAQPGSAIRTDNLSGYSALADSGFEHIVYTF
ncbi:MAG: transposase [Thermodesulfobacteriota bacterium]|nr:transposase [Thermodesulfobacteriota bacterium]